MDSFNLLIYRRLLKSQVSTSIPASAITYLPLFPVKIGARPQGFDRNMCQQSEICKGDNDYPVSSLCFDHMKIVIWIRIERVQRIIAIQGVSLVRILNHPPSLDRSGEILNILSLSRSVRRISPSFVDIHESLPPSLFRSGRIYGSSLACPPVSP